MKHLFTKTDVLLRKALVVFWKNSLQSQHQPNENTATRSHFQRKISLITAKPFNYAPLALCKDIHQEVHLMVIRKLPFHCCTTTHFVFFFLGGLCYLDLLWNVFQVSLWKSSPYYPGFFYICTTNLTQKWLRTSYVRNTHLAKNRSKLQCYENPAIL